MRSRFKANRSGSVVQMVSTNHELVLVLAEPFYDTAKIRDAQSSAERLGAKIEPALDGVRVQLPTSAINNEDLWMLLESCQRYARVEQS